MKTEHKVIVENGKYTFVVPAGDHRIIILRHGEPWHGPQGEASNALLALMCELDAARVVVQAARDARARLGEPRAQMLMPSIIDALAKHDRLCDDRQPPSERMLRVAARVAIMAVTTWIASAGRHDR